MTLDPAILDPLTPEGPSNLMKVDTLKRILALGGAGLLAGGTLRGAMGLHELYKRHTSPPVSPTQRRSYIRVPVPAGGALKYAAAKMAAAVKSADEPGVVAHAADAVGMLKHPGQDFSPLGKAFWTHNAQSMTDMPWVYPAAAAASLGGLYAGWKGVDSLLGARHKAESKQDLELAKRRYQAALTGQFKSAAGGAIDEAAAYGAPTPYPPITPATPYDPTRPSFDPLAGDASGTQIPPDAYGDPSQIDPAALGMAPPGGAPGGGGGPEAGPPPGSPPPDAGGAPPPGGDPGAGGGDPGGGGGGDPAAAAPPMPQMLPDAASAATDDIDGPTQLGLDSGPGGPDSIDLLYDRLHKTAFPNWGGPALGLYATALGATGLGAGLLTYNYARSHSKSQAVRDAIRRRQEALYQASPTPIVAVPYAAYEHHARPKLAALGAAADAAIGGLEKRRQQHAAAMQAMVDPKGAAKPVKPQPQAPPQLPSLVAPQLTGG